MKKNEGLTQSFESRLADKAEQMIETKKSRDRLIKEAALHMSYSEIAKCVGLSKSGVAGIVNS